MLRGYNSQSLRRPKEKKTNYQNKTNQVKYYLSLYASMCVCVWMMQANMSLCDLSEKGRETENASERESENYEAEETDKSEARSFFSVDAQRTLFV